MNFVRKLRNLKSGLTKLLLLASIIIMFVSSLNMIIRGHLTSEWQQHAITTHSLSNENQLLEGYIANYDGRVVSLSDYQNRFAATEDGTFIPRHFTGYSIVLSILNELLNINSFDNLVKILSSLLLIGLFFVITFKRTVTETFLLSSLSGTSVVCFAGYGAWGTLDFSAFVFAVIGVTLTFSDNKLRLGVVFCAVAAFIHPVYFSALSLVVLSLFVRGRFHWLNFIFAAISFTVASLPLLHFYGSAIDGFSSGQQYLNFNVMLGDRIANYLFSPANGLFVYYLPLFLTLVFSLAIRSVKRIKGYPYSPAFQSFEWLFSLSFLLSALSIILFIASQPIPNPTYTYITRYGMPLTVVIIAYLIFIKPSVQLLLFNFFFGIFIAGLWFYSPEINRQKLGHQAPVEVALTSIFSRYSGTNSSFVSYLAPASFKGYSDYYDGKNLYVLSNGVNGATGTLNFFETPNTVNTIMGLRNSVLTPSSIDCERSMTRPSHVSGWDYIEPLTFHLNPNDSGIFDISLCVVNNDGNCLQVRNAIVDIVPEYLLYGSHSVDVSLLVRSNAIRKALNEGASLQVVSGILSCKLDAIQLIR